MTRPDQYASYLVSRYFSAFFGVTVSVLGPRYLVDMFFLHQRGRAFTILHLALNMGASAGPTFGGFVATSAYWPVEYWWSVGLTGLSIIVVFLFLEETTYNRTEDAVNRTKPDSWVKDRVVTFFPGNKVVPPTTWGHTVRSAARCSVTRPQGADEENRPRSRLPPSRLQLRRLCSSLRALTPLALGSTSR